MAIGNGSELERAGPESQNLRDAVEDTPDGRRLELDAEIKAFSGQNSGDIVTAQVPLERSGYAESADQRLRVLDQSVNDVPALLPGRRDEGADHGEVASAFLRPEAAGDFLPDLHHAPVALGLI